MLRQGSLPIICAALALLLSLPLASLGNDSVPCVFSAWKARVDNFDPLNLARYDQRYCVNDTWSSSSNSPVFLFLGGEAPVEFFNFQQVTFYEMAQQYGALAISLEHRYYGLSQPTDSVGLQAMRYLSSQQAMADAALFLTAGPLGNLAAFDPSSEAGSARKVVVWGCSYSGALSAFFRSKYPHLVVGAVAPSGPVYAVNNYSSYLNQFQYSVAEFPGCAEAVSEATAQIHDVLVSNDTAQLQALADTFGLCRAPVVGEDPFFFEYNLCQLIGTADQFNNPPQWPLQTTCALLVNGTKNATTPIEKFAVATQFNQLFDPSTGAVAAAPSCYDFNDREAYIKDGQVPGTTRSWWYQSCTEFGFFNPSYPTNDVFFPNSVVPLEKIDQFCTEWFSGLTVPQVLSAINQTNAYFGGLSMLGSNIVFSNGFYDPWHRLSIVDPVLDSNGNELIGALNVQAGHCAIMTAATPSDPPSLISARKSLALYLASWLAQ